MYQPKYWIATISKEHTQRGVSGNFIQVCHGKQAPLKRMKKGDYIVVYSSKIKMDENDKLQAFTAIAQISDEGVYEFQMTETFKPFRRNVHFFECEETPIIPLINELDFIQNKKAWGYPFRYGFFEIQEKDFNLLASKLLPDAILKTNNP